MRNLGVVRAGHACVRCKRQKKKCDGAIPKCSHCRRSNVACDRENSIGGSHIAVWNIKEFEAEVSELEKQAFRHTGIQQLDVMKESIAFTPFEEDTSGANFNPETIEPRVGKDLNAQGPSPGLDVLANLNNATVYDFESYDLKHMARKALLIDNQTLGKHGNKRQDSSNPMVRVDSTIDARSALLQVPIHQLNLYLDRYYQYIHPTFPIYHKESANTTLRHLTDPESAPLDSNTTSLVLLALSLGAIYPNSNSILDASYACRFWLIASKHLDRLDQSEDTIRILILLSVYSIFEDGCGSSWTLAELSLRSCLELGLHSKSDNSPASPEHVALFWSSYLLDRWVCCTLGLPTSLSNDEFEQEIPIATTEDTYAIWPIGLWSIAYNQGQINNEHYLIDSSPTHISESLPRVIASDLQVASAANQIIQEGAMAAVKYEKLALDSLSAAEIAAMRGVRLPWTTGYSIFVSSMIKLISVVHTPRYRLLLPPNPSDSTYNHISKAALLLQSLSCKFSFLDSLSQALKNLQSTNPASLNIRPHSKVFTIASWGLQAVEINVI